MRRDIKFIDTVNNNRTSVIREAQAYVTELHGDDVILG